MNRLNRTVSVLALCFLIAGVAAADTLVEKFAASYPMARGGFTLSNVNGSVDITAWDRSEVRIEAEKRIRSRSREAATAAMERFRIDVEVSGEGVSVETKYPKRSEGVFELFDFFSGSDVQASVNYKIMVPRSAMVRVDTVNSSIDISGVEGGFELETVNGGIDVAGGAGSLRASTVNGSIEAELFRVAPEDIRLSTVNGRVRLGLPSSVRADLDVTTVNGRIESELPVAAMEAGKRRLRGSINGGGDLGVRISTVNGSVSLSGN